MTVTMTNADKALKTYYLEPVAEQLNTGINPFFAAIKKNSTDVWGKEVRRAVSYGVNGGIGAGTEDGNLPSASGNKYEQMVLSLKNLYGTLEITDKAVRASENNAGAFANLLNSEMEGLINSSAFNFGRMLYGDGTGTLCTITAITNGVVTMDDVRNLMEGMYVDFHNGSTVVTGYSCIRINSIDRNAKTVTFSKSISSAVSVGNTLTIQGSYNNELTGLGAIFKNTGTLYGLARVNYGWTIPYMKGSVGSITESEVQKAIDYVLDVANSKVNFILCSSGVRRAFQDMLATKGIPVEYKTVAGGFKALMYNDIPIVADRFCPAGTMYLLNTDDFILHQLCDWQFLEDEDGKVLHQVAGKPVYSATLVKYAEMMCIRPSGQAMLSGITEA